MRHRACQNHCIIGSEVQVSGRGRGESWVWLKDRLGVVRDVAVGTGHVGGRGQARSVMRCGCDYFIVCSSGKGGERKGRGKGAE